jgi:exodeoxyribonuclease III
MKIATFNVNNIIKRFDNLATWLQRSQPDVVCLQELKCEHGKFPAAALQALGYQAIWKGERSWNGVAILSRGRAPVMTRETLPGNPDDRQSRYIEAAVGGVMIGCVYVPNGNPQPGPKFDYKLAWMRRFHMHADQLLGANVPAVLAGDFNVVPTDFDIYSTRSYVNNALLQPQPRAEFKRLLKQGWTDAIRTLHPDDPAFSFWSYMRNRWSRDAGLRLDMLLLSPALAPQLRAGGVDRWVRDELNASDHAPVWIEMKTSTGKRSCADSARGR